jgi:hypothetical protein
MSVDLDSIEVSVSPLVSREAAERTARRVRAWKQAHPEKNREYYRKAHPRTCAEDGCLVDITGTGRQRCGPHAEAREAELRRRRPERRAPRRPWRSGRQPIVIEPELEVVAIEPVKSPHRKRAGSTSSYWGVAWDRSRKKWIARAGGTFVGRFASEEEAARAREARITELGLDDRLNFPEAA